MNEGKYWHGTVLCPRKALSHINRERCLELHDTSLCGSCANNKIVLDQILKEDEAEARRRAECRELVPERKRKKT